MSNLGIQDVIEFLKQKEWVIHYYNNVYYISSYGYMCTQTISIEELYKLYEIELNSETY